MIRLSLLAFFAACSGPNDSKDSIGAHPTDADADADSDSDSDADADTDTDTDPGADRDGDGVPDDSDCMPDDSSVFPGASEVCDGVDQDCDGLIDDGVPSDGQGCADPGWPSFPAIVDTIQIVVATESGTFSGSDSNAEVCLGTWCHVLDIADWNDRDPSGFDVHTIEGVGLNRADATSFVLKTANGSDRWEPAGMAVSFDGEGVYARANPGIYIGDGGADELLEYTDVLAMHSDTIWAQALTHGPWLGAPLADGVRISLRTDRTRHVEVRVAPTQAELLTVDPVAHRYPGVATDFVQTLAVTGLGHRATWFYDVHVDGVRSGPWSFTTPPAPGLAGTARIAFGSCTKQDAQPIFGVINAENPDLFLFVGDNHYGNTADVDAQRQWYRWAHGRSGRAEMMQGRPLATTWDDHDFVGNNTDGNASGKTNALKVFGEYWANGELGTPSVAGVFHKQQWGDVDLFFIDDRYWRAVETEPDGSPRMLGAGQEDWLLSEVRASTATFKLVVSGSQWSADGSSDSWAVHGDRERVVEALAAEGGVVLLSGDIHRSEFRATPTATYSVPEITSSSMAYAVPSPCRGGTLACYAANNVIVMDVDTVAVDPTLTARILDEAGAEVASWVIERSELGP